MSGGLLLSGYPAAPAEDVLGSGSIDTYYSGLAGIAGVGSVELPVDRSGRLVGGRRALARIAPQWSIVLTTVPGTKARRDENPEFGLASSSPTARADAVKFVRAVRTTARWINTTLGREAVRAISLVTAPQALAGRSAPSSTALLDSLLRLTGEQTAGPDLFVEHCDTLIPGHRPAKGYLHASDEVEALVRLRGQGHVNCSLLINWGRSALERRCAQAPVDHLRLARDSGVLGGLVFSGCSSHANPYGPAWADTHSPLAPFGADPGEPSSLLTQEEIHRSLEFVLPDTLIGVKISLKPDELSVPQRVTRQRQTVERINTALAQALR